MSAKRIHIVKNRRKFYIMLAAALLVFSAGVFILKQKKEMLVREGTDFLQRLVSRETQFDIKIGKISGRLSGVVRFENVRLEDPALPAGLKLILRAKEIEIRYRLVDFLTKNFVSKIVVTVREPELYLRPHVSLRHDRFGLFGWLRKWALAQRHHLQLIVKDLKLVLGPDKREFAGIQIEYLNDAFQIHAPLRHWEVWRQDISTQLNVRGRFQPGLLSAPDSVSGEIFTEGTVINWGPLPWESRFEFTLSADKLEAQSSNFLGGFGLSVAVDLDKEDEIQVVLETRQYPLSNLGPFLGTGVKAPLQGRLDLEARLQGYLRAPNLEAYATITGGSTGAHRYQTMNLHVAGVYPTLRLTDSRILLDDGQVMRFADQTLELKDLFDPSIYKKLVSASDQEMVVMGDWEFRRPMNENQRPEFLMQRSFGKNAQFHVKKFNETDEEKLDSPETNEMELGFEYRLKSKNSLKFKMREDERFVGVERKMNF
jgi:hypothetical protein